MNRERIVQVLMVISLVLLVIFLLWFMFGNSPTLEQIFVMFVAPFALGLFGVYDRLNNKIMAPRERIHHDMTDIRKELTEVKEAIARIEGSMVRRK